MQNFNDFLNKIKNQDELNIPCYYRNQFKSQESIIDHKFYEISEKLLTQEYHKLNKKWNQLSKQLFIFVFIKYFQMKNKKTINPTPEEWKELTRIFGIEEQILKQRWITLIAPMAKSLIWEKEEDHIIKLQMNIKQGKHIWTEIALELYNHNNGAYVRTPKQVRERWMNYLNPILKKSSWTDQEDSQLLTLIVQNGKKWSMISKVLGGRTENQVKNRYKSLIHKIQQEQDDDIDELIAVKQHISKKIFQHPDQKNHTLESDIIEIPKYDQKVEIQKQESDLEIPNQLLKKTKTEKLDQIAIKQDNFHNQLKTQFCFSTQGDCDIQSLGNRSSLSDLNYIEFLITPEINDNCIEQKFKINQDTS